MTPFYSWPIFGNVWLIFGNIWPNRSQLPSALARLNVESVTLESERERMVLCPLDLVFHISDKKWFYVNLI